MTTYLIITTLTITTLFFYWRSRVWKRRWRDRTHEVVAKALADAVGNSMGQAMGEAMGQAAGNILLSGKPYVSTVTEWPDVIEKGKGE